MGDVRILDSGSSSSTRLSRLKIETQRVLDKELEAKSLDLTNAYNWLLY